MRVTILPVCIVPGGGTMLLVSSQLLLLVLPRVAMRKRGRCCRPVSVRISVRPFVRRRVLGTKLQ